MSIDDFYFWFDGAEWIAEMRKNEEE